MDNTKIVNLGQVRDILSILDKARAEVLAGRVLGVFTALQDSETGESIYLSGSYKATPGDAMKAGMRAAATSSLAPLDEEEELPSRFRASGM